MEISFLPKFLPILHYPQDKTVIFAPINAASVNTIREIEAFNRLFNQPTLHPMVSIGDLSRAERAPFGPTRFEMYCVVLSETPSGTLLRGGAPLACPPGSLFTLRPGQVMQAVQDEAARPRGRILAFRPELLEKTGLGRDFYMFDYFNRSDAEALALSARERDILKKCFESILSELRQEQDYLTNHMIRLCIGRLLSCCKRFFERRYPVRNASARNLGPALDALIDNYLSSGSAAQQGQPTVSGCAARFNLTPNYFGSLCRRELHMTAQEYIQQKIISAAQRLLTTTDMGIGEIAEELGFSYANHFTRMFTRRVGLAPQQYRKQLSETSAQRSAESSR